MMPIMDRDGKVTKILVSGYPVTSMSDADLSHEQAMEFGWPAAMKATKSTGKKRSFNDNDGTLPLSSKAG
jgi:hypothetical protein